MALVYRTTGAWGDGLDDDLEPEQIDQNFYELQTRIEAIEENPPEPVSIDTFEVEGTLLTIHLTNGAEHGPFILPIAQWRWTGEWQPATTYFVGDIVENDSNIYFVRVQHISDATFDPGRFEDEGFVYILILAKASQPYDVALYYADIIDSGEEVFMVFTAVREQTFAANFAGSFAWLRVATSESAIVLPVYQNENMVGTITFQPGISTTVDGGQFGSFATLDPDSGITMVAGDRLSVAQPYEHDPSAAGLSVNFASVVASL